MLLIDNFCLIASKLEKLDSLSRYGNVNQVLKTPQKMFVDFLWSKLWIIYLATLSITSENSLVLNLNKLKIKTL